MLPLSPFLHQLFIFNGISALSSFTQEQRDINVLKFSPEKENEREEKAMEVGKNG